MYLKAAVHPSPGNVHVTKTESSKRVIVLYKSLVCEKRECQSLTQRGYGEGNEVRASRALLSVFRQAVADLEILEVGKGPIKYGICWQESLGSLGARNRRVGARCSKYR